MDSSNGVPGSALSQIQYSPRNSSWYKAVKIAGVPIVFGTTTEPQYGKEGIVFAIPLFNSTTVFSGVIEVFAQTSILANSVTSITNKYANVSYIMDVNNFLIATSISPELQSFVTPQGVRVSALNSTNAIIRASAEYVISQQIFSANTFIVPHGSHSKLLIALTTIPSVSSVELGWKIVSVQVIGTVLPSLTHAPSSSPTISNPAPTSSQVSSVSAAEKSGIIAAIVIGSVAILMMVGLVAARFLCMKSSAPPSTPSRPSDVEIVTTTNAPF